jgi:hypothetical protein
LNFGRKLERAGNPLLDEGHSELKNHYAKDLPKTDRSRYLDRCKELDRSRDLARSKVLDRSRDRERPARRSRSRSRSRERNSRKRRSDSPYSVATDNWKKFKQAERVSILKLVKKQTRKSLSE